MNQQAIKFDHYVIWIAKDPKEFYLVFQLKEIQKKFLRSYSQFSRGENEMNVWMVKKN